MSGDSNNGRRDGEPPDRRGPDAHGEAALLLVESLLHALVAKSVFSVSEAVEIVDVAAEVREEVALERGTALEHAREALTLLSSIAKSLEIDVA